MHTSLTECICFLCVSCSFIYRSSSSPDIPGVKSSIRSLERKPAALWILTPGINSKPIYIHTCRHTGVCHVLSGPLLIPLIPSATNPNLHPHHSISHPKTMIWMYSHWNSRGLIRCFHPINYLDYWKRILSSQCGRWDSLMQRFNFSVTWYQYAGLVSIHRAI